MSSGLKITGLKLNVGSFSLTADSMMVSPGKIVGVMGQSGSGKSTLLGAIAGFVPLEAGQIVISGKDVTAVPPERRGIAFVTQRPALFPNMTVLQNVAFSLRVRGMEKAEREKKAMEWLERCKIAPLAQRYPEGLSGGESQRVAFGRALITGNSVLLLDEPFASLDVGLRETLRQEVRAWVTDANVCALLVSHDPEDMAALTESVYTIANGMVK